jgi:hypothetical protein
MEGKFKHVTDLLDPSENKVDGILKVEKEKVSVVEQQLQQIAKKQKSTRKGVSIRYDLNGFKEKENHIRGVLEQSGFENSKAMAYHIMCDLFDPQNVPQKDIIESCLSIRGQDQRVVSSERGGAGKTRK